MSRWRLRLAGSHNNAEQLAGTAISTYRCAPDSTERLATPVCYRVALALLAFLACAASPARAHDHGAPGVNIVDAWAPATTPGQDRQLVYLTIKNRAAASDRLIRALSPVAAKVEIHGASQDGGEPKPLAELAIGAGENLVLDAGGPHLALLGLKRVLLEKQTFKLALEFDAAGRIVIDVTVGPPSPNEPHHH